MIWSVLPVSDFSGDRFILGPLQLFIITSLAMFLHWRDCRVDSALEISTIVASIATNKATRMPRIFCTTYTTNLCNRYSTTTTTTTTNDRTREILGYSMSRSCFFALLTRQLSGETCHRADLAIVIVLPGSQIPRCPQFTAQETMRTGVDGIVIRIRSNGDVIHVISFFFIYQNRMDDGSRGRLNFSESQKLVKNNRFAFWMKI